MRQLFELGDQIRHQRTSREAITHPYDPDACGECDEVELTRGQAEPQAAAKARRFRFPWTKRAQRRRDALAEAALLDRAEHDAALGLLAPMQCGACPDGAPLIPGGMFAEHLEARHPSLLNDPVC